MWFCVSWEVLLKTKFGCQVISQFYHRSCYFYHHISDIRGRDVISPSLGKLCRFKNHPDRLQTRRHTIFRCRCLGKCCRKRKLFVKFLSQFYHRSYLSLKVVGFPIPDEMAASVNIKLIIHPNKFIYKHCNCLGQLFLLLHLGY